MFISYEKSHVTSINTMSHENHVVSGWNVETKKFLTRCHLEWKKKDTSVYKYYHVSYIHLSIRKSKNIEI